MSTYGFKAGLLTEPLRGRKGRNPRSTALCGDDHKLAGPFDPDLVPGRSAQARIPPARGLAVDAPGVRFTAFGAGWPPSTAPQSKRISEAAELLRRCWIDKPQPPHSGDWGLRPRFPLQTTANKGIAPSGHCPQNPAPPVGETLFEVLATGFYRADAVGFLDVPKLFSEHCTSSISSEFVSARCPPVRRA
jgi:hypothetical protein